MRCCILRYLHATLLACVACLRAVPATMRDAPASNGTPNLFVPRIQDLCIILERPICIYIHKHTHSYSRFMYHT
jgi:hypothetical protein